MRSYRGGRTCGHGACDTVLSVYNPSKYCSIHAKLEVGGRKRIQPRPIKDVICEHCGEVFETANVARRFCSDNCRMAAFARRKRAAVRVERRLQQEQAPEATVQAPSVDLVLPAA